MKSDRNGWINRRSRIYWYDQYALNEQAAAFSQYDPDRITRELVATGAEIIALYAANQYGIAYYPSAIWPQHPGLQGRDYFGDLLARLRARGKKIIAYVNWLDSKHPEWNLVPPGADPAQCRAEQPLAGWADPAQPNGRVQALQGGQWQCPCPLSPKRTQILAIAREIAAKYQPDAFHLDMFHYLEPCVCDFCRPALQKICGTEDITMDVISRHWNDYIDWRCATNAALIADVTAALRAYGVVAAHNASIPLVPVAGGFGEEWLQSLDVFLSEAFDAFLCPYTDLNTSSITVKLHHGLGKPSWMLRTSTPVHYAHWPITRAQWQLYAAACKANGGKAFGPCGVGARPDTTSARELLENIKAGFDFYMEDADLDQGAVSAARVALIFSWATRKYFAMDLQWVDEFVGWARLLIEEHLPYDILVAERIGAAAALSKYDLVILPNTANLSEGFCAAAREYVRQGGRILATAETALRDEKGGRRNDFALGDVLGIGSQGGGEGLFAIERPSEPEPAAGIFQKVRAAGKLIARYVELDPAGSVAGMKDPLPAAPRDWPVYATHSFGKGQSSYIAFDIGRYFSTHGDAHIGRFMAGAIDDLLPARQILVKAPRTVEVTIWQQATPPRAVIHLANRTVPWTLPTDKRQITEIIPVHDIELKMASPFARPVVSGRQADVRSRLDGSHLVITVPRLEAYAAIIIESGETI